MSFQRDLQYYNEHDVPETAYQKAKQVWDNRLGNAVVQARNWRRFAFGLLFLSVITSGLAVVLLQTDSIVPYIVEIDSQGRVHNINPGSNAISQPRRRLPIIWKPSLRISGRSHWTLSWYGKTGLRCMIISQMRPSPV